MLTTTRPVAPSLAVVAVDLTAVDPAAREVDAETSPTTTVDAVALVDAEALRLPMREEPARQ